MMGPPYRARRTMPGPGRGPGSLPEESSPEESSPEESRPGLGSWSADSGPGGRAIATLSGVRHPIVAILLLISFFTAISGKPIDGLLILIVAAGLAWDGAQPAGDTRGPGAGPADGQPTDARPAHARLAEAALTNIGVTEAGLTNIGVTEAGLTNIGVTEAGLTNIGVTEAGLTSAGLTDAGLADPGLTHLTDAGLTHTSLADGGPSGITRPAGPEFAGRATTARRRSAVVGWLACGALYAVVVGTFARYSWPATVAVIGLGAAVVLVGWQGPVRDRPVPAPLPFPGTALWGGLLVTGGLWELSALLQQPNLSADSYAHPTISSLTDPLLGSHPGRSLALALWLGLGWLVVRR
jgi:hypothetical protein